jgi:hypothetical protein
MRTYAKRTGLERGCSGKQATKASETLTLETFLINAVIAERRWNDL